MGASARNPMMIYVIEAQNDLIKVGMSRSVDARLLAMRLLCPVLVRLVAQWPAKPGMERALHKLMEAQRSHAEWFRVEGAAKVFLDEVRGRGVDGVPEWSALVFEPGKAEAAQDASRRVKGRYRRPKSEATPLLRWMTANRVSLDDFAATVGYSRWAVKKWVYGQRVPHHTALIAIETATSGALKPNDLVPASSFREH